MFELPPLSHYFPPDHEQFRASLRDFVSREITPFVNEWDEAGTFPRALYRRAAELGATGLGYPEEYGGTPADIFYQLVLAEEYARCGCGGVQASLNSHMIALPPLLAAGSDALKRRVLPAVLRGDKIAALAVTEPSGGSDVAATKAMQFCADQARQILGGMGYMRGTRSERILSRSQSHDDRRRLRGNPQRSRRAATANLRLPSDMTWDEHEFNIFTLIAALLVIELITPRLLITWISSATTV